MYEQKFAPERAKPIVAINTTHGTGTEVDRFAVASILEKEYKPAIAYDCIYPTFSIDDPELTKTLPEKQSIYTSLDALNHVTEASTTVLTNSLSINLARDTVELIAEYLPKVIEEPENLETRYFLMYASMIAGVSFDNGMLHLTHALEHPLSAVKPDLPHGLGLAMLLPAVVKYTYKVKPQILAYIYQPIIPGLKGISDEAEEVAAKLEQWIFELGVKEKLADVGFSEEDIPKLVKLAFETPVLDLLLNSAPMNVDKELVKTIYSESMKPYN
ncbi:iron-containing alcohol dehydrogenase [Thermotoga sp. KOL6]|uniref:iron-containing alcohol dehydrogenase n=1 Tax=Thermotoga sp. KOL6 TaxID=126741 RepID=UPI0021013961|nr:iron-containing alcohol dehydrogenase [Thermotoga sp. KOL6]